MSIPAGYQIQASSWENDGDNWKTEIISGLTREEVEFYIVMLDAARHSGYENEYSEDCEDYDKANEAVFEFVMKYYEGRDIPEKFKEYIEYREFPVEDVLGNSECYIFRVYDNHKVFYIPEPIEEVTSEFKSITQKRH